MRSLLLDTNVISELRRSRSKIDPQVRRWSESQEMETCFISIVTIYELERGIALLKNKDVKQATDLSLWFARIKDDEFRGRILPISTEVACRAALVQSQEQKSLPDAFIAATALEHDLVLATRNVRDFLRTGVSIVNPWETGSPTIVMV